jgi:UDP-N-acetylmuramyl pentapeptide synthase
MNQALQVVENKKVGQRLTESVGCHRAEGNGFVTSRYTFFVCDELSLDVAETGASAALVSDPPRAINSLRGLSLLQVQDTLTKLHKLAPSYRQLMPLRPVVSSLPLSSGKATTQEFVCDELSLDVAETGASAALVSDPPRAINSLRGLSLLQVQDTLTKLHKLAPSYRQLMPLRPEWN